MATTRRVERQRAELEAVEDQEKPQGRGISGKPIWQAFYCEPLKEHWSRTRKDTQASLAERLADATGREAPYLKQVVSAKPPFPELVPYLEALLLESSFPDQFLDLVLPFRQERLRTRSNLERHARYLKAMVPKPRELFRLGKKGPLGKRFDEKPWNQSYWLRWVELFEARCDRLDGTEKDKSDRAEVVREALEQVGTDPQKDKRRGLTAFASDRISEWKVAGLQIISHLKWLDACYAAMVHLTALQWHRYLGEAELLSKANLDPADLLSRADENVQVMERAIDENPSALRGRRDDTRIMRLYLEGTRLIGVQQRLEGSNRGHFRSLAPLERAQLIETGETILSNKRIQPTAQDSYQYRLWWDYYRYLHEQRRAHDAMEHGRFRDGLAFLSEALTTLNSIEPRAEGYPHLLAKVIAHQREGHFLMHSIRILLLEKETELSTQPGAHAGLLDWQRSRRKEQAESMVEWILRLERQFHGSESPYD